MATEEKKLTCSLMSSFRRIPPAAIPATLDCILSSTSSPSSLFSLLLDSFPILSHEATNGSKDSLDDEVCNFIASYVNALCHLLKKPGLNAEALQDFVWRVLIPLMRLTQGYDREIVDKAMASFLDVVMETNAWVALEETMVSYFIKLVGLSMGMLQNEQSALYRWTAQANGPEEPTLATYESFPLFMSCHILASILDASVKGKPVTDSTPGSIIANGCGDHLITGNLLWDIYNVTLQMLSHSPEHRSCAITVFLPQLLKTFVSEKVLEIEVHGQEFILSRKTFITKIWKCCKSLFLMGPSEKRDAYTVLSLYISYFSKNDGCDDEFLSGDEIFDLRTEKEFWDEMKKGLVDKESIVRKQSLHILKSTAMNGKGKRKASILETIPNESSSNSSALTKRERWAKKEAKSLGIESLCDSVDSNSSSQLKWGAFFMLYEMLEEYGTHLVEAAWNHQMNLLLHTSNSSDNLVKPVGERLHLDPMETLEHMFDWLAVLWQRGLCHDNPQVRCLTMQSVYGIEWKNHGSYAKFVPREFVLGPFIQGLNDPVHHKEFGVKGVYTSRTIDGASTFLEQYTVCLSEWEQMTLLSNLASLAKTYSFGRAGLMSLAECVAAAAAGISKPGKNEAEKCDEAPREMKSDTDSTYYNDEAALLDVFRFIIESSKQHFNPNYRLKVCGKILDATVSVMSSSDVPLESVLHFISSFPADFFNYGGSLTEKVQEWLRGNEKQGSTCSLINVKLMKNLAEFPKSFVNHSHSANENVNYDDEDLETWEVKAKRWARVLFLIIEDEHQLDTLLQFIQTHGNELSKKSGNLEWLPVKFLVLVSSIIQELHEMKNINVLNRAKRTNGLLGKVDHAGTMDTSMIIRKFAKSFTFILEELVSYTNQSCSVFWAKEMGNTTLPSSITGRLGGLSQRRLSSSNTTAVVQAIKSVKTLASICSYCAQFEEVSLNSDLDTLWQLSWKIISRTTCDSETKAEIYLGGYESLHHILKSLVFMRSSSALSLLTRPCSFSATESEVKQHIDYFVEIYLENINNLIDAGYLTRARRAILIELKWMCMESLLTIPKSAIQRGVYIENCDYLFSDAVVRKIFNDLMESLENAGEGSVLPMLRSVRLVLDLFALAHKGSAVSSSGGIDVQMMWLLVHSSWLLHVSCNKRRVAPIAALLSSVLHESVFGNMAMHEFDNTTGPLKWFVEKILDEGTRSPRTIRLAALHLTGLWLSHPSAIKYYMKELKLLTLYGSVAFDEDFEAEVTENHDARTEVSILSTSPDPELTEVFINTELYARVSVAVMFNKLADTSDTTGSHYEVERKHASLQSGKLFLLELLQSAVSDTDLSKELYKKYSATHRRKVRAWQMICILSHFVDQEIVSEVMNHLHTALYNNNMPGVRQYLETFAVHVYLKFPSLVGEQLVPMVQKYDMRTQALSSYVFIAANVILHASKDTQLRHLDDLLPPIVPLLTSHHHSLRGFTQLLVYQVLSKLLPVLDSSANETLSLEKRCFVELKSYLEDNSDCARLRVSMEVHLDAFDPKKSITPAGIFSNRVDDTEFECANVSLLERVIDFLNDVRKDLRSSMAKDATQLKNEQIHMQGSRSNGQLKEETTAKLPNDMSLDFQKKVIISKHETQDSHFSSLNNDSYNSLLDVEKEDQLLDQSLRARNIAMGKLKEGRQEIILVASLIDRVPNLAGLARTCEVFKAASLVVDNVNILNDKQFQLISVTAEKWVPIIEVPVSNVTGFLEKKKKEGYSILGLEQTANSVALDQYVFPKKTVLVLGREKEGIPVELIHILDACIEIPQMGVVRSLNVHVSGAIALWEYTRQQRS
ncbi:tRNA/rRNA methyltransferase (SpoU) family protein [Artemisia annua]|uniref:tRNA (guanosine(18)-2'-O)-methyltransferase TARBP1 n=1 Tax=Artemisia annua TaxID=35608 RepID=A0A2U1NGV1_ARTAN|nr:tRNA/rRNA methyltransferase (SpoU) family protein [Artemisia annua]